MLDQKALAAKNTKAMCADEDISLAVISGLGLPDSYDALPLVQLVPASQRVRVPHREERAHRRADEDL